MILYIGSKLHPGAIPAAHLYHTLYWELVTPRGYSSGTSVPIFILGVSYIRGLFQRHICTNLYIGSWLHPGAIPAAHLYRTLYWELVTPGGYSSGTSVPYFILGVSYTRGLFQPHICTILYVGS